MKVIHGPTNVIYRDFSTMQDYIVDDFGNLIQLKDEILEQAMNLLKSVFVYNKGDIGA